MDVLNLEDDSHFKPFVNVTHVYSGIIKSSPACDNYKYVPT